MTVVTPEFLVAVVTIIIVLGDCGDTRVPGGCGYYNYSALVTVVTPEFLVAVVTIIIVLGDCGDTRVLGGCGDVV